MAKGGTNLNPGADATLVAAATRAAMANVPKDLSGTFESMAEEYGKTMRAVGESFALAAKEVGKIGGVLVKKAFEEEGLINRTSNDRYAIETEIEVQGPQTEEDAGAPGGLITTDTSDDPKPRETTKKTTIGDELRSIRKELSSLFLKTDKKSRARKNELRAQREQFSNDIKTLDDARNITDDQLKSGNVNFQNTGKLNLAFKQGMNAFGTKTGTINEGEFEGYKLVPSRDKNGKIGFMLKDKQGNFVTGEDENGNLVTGGEKPHFVSSAETKNLLEMNMDQKTVNDANKIITGAFTSGKQGVPYMGNQLVGKFRPILDNETTLRQLSDVSLGDDSKTLREHVNGESEYSAEIFAGLSSVDLASMGVIDADNDGFIGDNPSTEKVETGDFVGGDVAASNFKKVRSATFDKTNPSYDDGSHLRKLTEKHIYRTGEIMHGVGANSRGTTPAWKAAGFSNIGQYEEHLRGLNNPSEITIKDYENIKFGNQNMKGPTALKVLNDIPTGTVTDPRDGSTYNWNNDGWYDGDNKNVAKDNDTFVKDVLQLMDPRFYGIANIASNSGSGKNPFGETQANRAPADFVTAVGKDDIYVVKYLEGMGITVTNKLGDKVEVEINGKTKTFTVDPNIASDESRANEMWKWMFNNWTKKKLK